jgi:exonuclease III
MMMIDHHKQIKKIQTLNIPPPKKKKRKKINLPQIFKLGTLNINFFTETKKHILYDILKDNNIQILGLSETHLTKRQSRRIFHEFKNEYTFYYDVDETSIKSTGVGIIIKNEFNLRVINSNSYRGRIIYVDLLLERKKKIRIIQFYGHSGASRKSNNEFNETIKPVYDKLIEFVQEAKARQFDVIVMGDFNLHYEKYAKKIINQITLRPCYELFKQIEDKYLLVDIFKEINDININNPLDTCITNTGKKKVGSRIDYIWCSEVFLENSIDTYLYDVHDLLRTDHKLLLMTINGYEYIGRTFLKKERKNKNQKFKYNYESLDEDCKKLFQDSLDNRLKDKLSPDNLSLNETWNNLSDILREVADEVIGKKEINIESRNYNPIKDSTSFKIYREILILVKSLKSKSKSRQLLKYWSSYIPKLRRWSEDKIEMGFWDWDYPLTEPIRLRLAEKLKILKELYFIEYKNEIERYKEEKIKNAIEQRCIDLKDNQKRMINNICEKEMRKIIIDHIYLEDECIIITDDNRIKEEVNKHFQNVAGTVNKEKIIPDGWIETYQPLNYVDDSIYKILMDVPTMDELSAAISKLPKGKAAGPSGIDYELFQLASPTYIEQLRNLIEKIFKNEMIPEGWKIAYVYPIPKPKPWGSRLVNTRPITLLETARKLTVSILTQRLMKIIYDNNVLRGNQFAGLPSSSTFEPIRILNEIIQDANEEDNELWILSLDMSKAYDRVNIYMLEKAMDRIKLPLGFIRFIKELFLGRKNQVFTAKGLTDPYDVLVGIDQGEIISPLLWCIYYDPLLCHLQKKNIGYNLRATKITNIYDNEIQTLEKVIPCMAYMDDTNIISNNLENLEELLESANEFYDLNDIQINKEKSELLLRKPDVDDKKRIAIRFGGKTITIKPLHPKDSMRILGVWFNAYDDNKFVYRQIYHEILQFAKLIKSKSITDKHMMYLFNVLIIPKIEYRAQVRNFTAEQNDKLLRPFRRVFKNKLKFAITAPNSIVENSLIYNIRSFNDNQLQSKITNFVIHINSSDLLGEIMHIRLTKIQTVFLLEKSILLEFPYDIDDVRKINRKYQNNYIINNLFLMKLNNFGIQQDNDVKKVKNNYIGGIDNKSLLLRKIIKKDSYIKNFKFLKAYQLIYLDQISTLRGDQILGIQLLQQRGYILEKMTKNHLGYHIEYEEVKREITTNGFNLKPEFVHIDQGTSLKGTKLLIANTRDISRDCRKQFTNLFYSKDNDRIFFGRIQEFDNNYIVFKHFDYTYDNNNGRLILSKCQGCELNTNKDSRSSYCKVKQFYYNAFRINIASKYLEITLDGCIIHEFQFSEIQEILRRYYLLYVDVQQQQMISRRINNNNTHIMGLDHMDNRREFISNYIDFSLCREKLIGISHNLIKRENQCIDNDRSSYNIYSDGSVIDLGKLTSQSTFATIVLDKDYQELDRFVSSCSNWVSSYRAEMFGLLVSLIILPIKSHAKVYTDSSSMIEAYNQLMSQSNMSIRNILKIQSNGILWSIILEIIRLLDLEIELVKVPAHRDNYFNNLVDNVAQSAHNNFFNLAINLRYENVRSLNWVPTWNNIVIEKNLRKFITLTTNVANLEKFLNLNRNAKYRTLNVDWESTFNNLNNEESFFETSFESSKFKRNKVRILIEELPTMEKMKQSFYSLYKHRKCPLCQIEDESFNHVWKCTGNQDAILELKRDHFQILLEEININLSNKKLFIDELQNIGDIDDVIWEFEENNNKFTFIDIVKGIIPESLVDYVEYIVTTKSQARKVLYNYRQRFISKINFLWKQRCEVFKAEDAILGISKKIQLDHKGKESFSPLRVQATVPKYEGQEGVRKHIYYGGKALGFTVYMDLVSSNKAWFSLVFLNYL